MKPFKLNDNPNCKSVFKVPERYFENAEAQIVARIEAAPKTISLWNRYPKQIMAIAAILILAFGVGMVWKIQVNAEEEAHWTALESYVAEHTDLTDEAYLDLVNLGALDTLPASKTATETRALEEILLENGNLEEYITQ